MQILRRIPELEANGEVITELIPFARNLCMTERRVTLHTVAFV